MSKLFFYIASSGEVTFVLCFAIIVLALMIPQKAKPKLPGEDVPIQRTVELKAHEPKPTYSTNPPTSGPYVKSSIRSGIYTTPISDSQLVSLLLKGWVAIEYNCQYKTILPTKIPLAQPTGAQGMPNQTNQSPQEVLASINEQNRICGETTKKLREIVKKKGEDKLIVFQNSKLDTYVAAVAWGKIEKQTLLNTRTLSHFIDYYRGREIK